MPKLFATHASLLPLIKYDCLTTRGFKALKQIVKLHFKLGNTDKMLEAYR